METIPSTVTVGGQRHRLPDAQLRQLRLLEVGVDPDASQRSHGEHLSAGADLLAQLYGPSHDVSRHRSEHVGALPREPCGPQVGLRQQDPWVSRGAGAGHSGLRRGELRTRLPERALHVALGCFVLVDPKTRYRAGTGDAAVAVKRAGGEPLLRLLARDGSLSLTLSVEQVSNLPHGFRQTRLRS